MKNCDGDNGDTRKISRHRDTQRNFSEYCIFSSRQFQICYAYNVHMCVSHRDDDSVCTECSMCYRCNIATVVVATSTIV